MLYNEQKACIRMPSCDGAVEEADESDEGHVKKTVGNTPF